MDKCCISIISTHLDFDMDSVLEVILNIFKVITGKRLVYQIYGGSSEENRALQNIQARLRMVMGYLFAQTLPWLHGRSGGYLLVLGTANVDEW
jgi:NAD+ synthase (glutamine-hydrolysing)